MRRGRKVTSCDLSGGGLRSPTATHSLLFPLIVRRGLKLQRLLCRQVKRPPHPGGQVGRVRLRVPSGLRKPGCDLRPKITLWLLLFDEFVGGLHQWEIAGPEISHPYFLKAPMQNFGLTTLEK
ncbi:hypothetical protein AVEN_50522-1 [Araneus ventricosus]|uniref:Uncharacterized protein n=1 Tax=Araneus ventricosus TaxID=182803 RepID=A0A4Y2ASI0_ARAVE|nr:hypothetical protein AVEN_50522-1 [Araneus ventricosus]